MILAYLIFDVTEGERIFFLLYYDLDILVLCINKTAPLCQFGGVENKFISVNHSD